MNDNQHTLKGSVTVKGVGLHTGEPVTLTLRPAPVGHGYKFQRTDLGGRTHHRCRCRPGGEHRPRHHPGQGRCRR